MATTNAGGNIDFGAFTGADTISWKHIGADVL